MRITRIQTTAVRVPLREPLKWTGGTRQSASGLIVEVHTDEGLVGVGEAPGPTLPAIETIVDRELAQFLVGEDPLRLEWLLHRMEEYSRNWSRIGAYAIAGLEMALLDLKGKALGVPVAELLGGFARDDVPRSSATSSSTSPRRTPAEAAEFVAQGYDELKLKVGRDLGQDHDTLAAIRDRVGSGRQDPDRREHELERPRGDQVDPGARAVRPPVRRAAGAGLRHRRAGAGSPLRRDADRGRRGVHDLRSALELIKARRVRRLRRLPLRGGRADARAADRGASRMRPASGARSAAGPSSASRRQRTSTSPPRRRTSRSRTTRTTHSSSNDVLTEALQIEDGRIEVYADRGSASPSIATTWRTLSQLELRESPFYDDIQGEAPRVGQIL